MHGGKLPDTGRYATEYLMADEFGWTFQQTQNTPEPVIDEFICRIQQRRTWEHKRHERDDQMRKARK